MIDVQYDIKKQHELKKQFDPDLVSKALSQAAKRAGDKVATQVSKDIRQTYAVKAGDIRKRLKVKRYRKYGGTQAYIWTGRGLPLSYFNPKQKTVKLQRRNRKGQRIPRRGATVRIRKDKGRQRVPGGWYAKGEIMRRRDADDNASQAIIAHGPSIPGMVAYPEMIDRVNQQLREDLPRQFDNRMRELIYRAQQKVGS